MARAGADAGASQVTLAHEFETLDENSSQDFSRYPML